MEFQVKANRYIWGDIVFRASIGVSLFWDIGSKYMDFLFVGFMITTVYSVVWGGALF